jgi:hypothetical protein
MVGATVLSKVITTARAVNKYQDGSAPSGKLRGTNSEEEASQFQDNRCE